MKAPSDDGSPGPVTGATWRREAAKVVAAAFSLWSLGVGAAQGEADAETHQAGNDTWEMMVCADPHAMPLSDRSGEGYENRIAEILADEPGAELRFDWYPQMQDMIDLRLRGGHCDIVMGVPDGAEPLLTTISYYTSPYVFVYRTDAGVSVSSLDDPELADLRIGLQNAGMPPHDSLLARGLADSIVAEYGTVRYAARDDPQARLVEAVLAGEVDIGVSWGPPAAYYAARHPGELTVVPIQPAIDPMPPFTNLQVPMTIGVRRGDEALRDELSMALASRWDDVRSVLESFSVPLVETGPPPVPGVANEDRVVVGYVGPNETGSRTVEGSLYEVVGDAARAGALLGEDMAVAGPTPQLDVVFSNAPSGQAASRAARRLVLLEGAEALIGGLGEGQAAAVAEVAEGAGIPFLNIGDDDLSLRCSEAFNVSPSASLYAAAIAEWYSEAGDVRWFVVRLNGERWSRAAEAFSTAVERSGGQVVGERVVAEADPVYSDDVQAALDAGADAIVAMVDAADQIAFLAQAGVYVEEIAVAPYPTAATQSRDFIASANRINRGAAPYRIAMWETTLADGAAAELNERFTSRFGRPMDPHAWAAYAAVTLLGGAAGESGALDMASVEEYLLAGEHDLSKERPLRFDPETRQLEQPLYVVRAVPDSGWGRTLSQQVGAAEFVSTVDVAGEYRCD